ncbi:hypothetical protein ACPOL_6536 [Acidisarcina polymorpha]|uniref:Uncharacterized protein n=1 Tax=Acidisarcina polymorpha TaxID=2211140 RepID=A0A2Z5GAW2_9BACT|nr:hypothetical protein ACPOL_6536 [Acidisarcina polymorpha]
MNDAHWLIPTGLLFPSQKSETFVGPLSSTTESGSGGFTTKAKTGLRLTEHFARS